MEANFSDNNVITPVLFWLELGASLVTQIIKKSPCSKETWVQSEGGEDPLEKEMTLLTVFLFLIKPDILC